MLWSKTGVGSSFWKGVTWALSTAKVFYCWNLGNGHKIAFWHDIWYGDCSLKNIFWDLFLICQQHDQALEQETHHQKLIPF